MIPHPSTVDVEMERLVREVAEKPLLTKDIITKSLSDIMPYLRDHTRDRIVCIQNVHRCVTPTLLMSLCQHYITGMEAIVDLVSLKATGQGGTYKRTGLVRVSNMIAADSIQRELNTQLLCGQRLQAFVMENSATR